MHSILGGFFGRTVTYMVNGTEYKYKKIILIRHLKHFETFLHPLVWTYSGYHILSICNITLRDLTWYFHCLNIWENECSIF